jgi:16S rRNA (guanine527-N7)-methyltransferase
MDILLKYFPGLNQTQLQHFEKLQNLYATWNAQINVISRKDIESLYERHVLHSLAIAKFIQFKPNTKILDIGTGGGFPGIPLSIFFPEIEVTMIDSIAKKIKVAEGISEELCLKNTDFAIGRVENLRETFHFITARAVAPAEQLYRWTQSYLDDREEFNSKINGYVFLKGGDLKQELKDLRSINKKLVVEEIPLRTWFDEPFFETKKLVYIF